MNVTSSDEFFPVLFSKMKRICPAVEDLEPYEFQYCLNNIIPESGWESVRLDTKEDIINRVNTRAFHASIQIKPRQGGKIILDQPITRLTQMLMVGLASNAYEESWIMEHFYFDMRGFFFLQRTVYFTDEVLAHLGGVPYRQFEQKQVAFEALPAIGYKLFKEANADVDAFFIESVKTLIAVHGTPVLIAIAGPTAAGKTEIVARLCEDFRLNGQQVASIELDNFLTDRDYREAKGIFTEGKRALHFELLKQSLTDISNGKEIHIPRYDFIDATSSHDLAGNLKPDGLPIVIQPAEIIFIEGNFPFLFEEITPLIDIKVVYLTDDPIRMKRKWKRDIDFRQKYDPKYFCNRYFKDQYIMAEIAYRPQMAVCDIVVDTTGAALWTSPEVAGILDQH